MTGRCEGEGALCVCVYQITRGPEGNSKDKTLVWSFAVTRDSKEYHRQLKRNEPDLRDSGAVLWQLWQDRMVIRFAPFRLGRGGHRLPDSYV